MCMRSKYLRELVDSFDMNRSMNGGSDLKMSLLPVPQNVSLESADIEYMHGRFYFVNSRNNESVESYSRAIDKYKRLGDLVGEAYACIYCGVNYREMRNYSEARKLFRRAYDIGVEISDSYIILFSILMSIVLYSHEGMQEESDRLRINTEAMVREVGHPKLTGDYYNNAAHTFLYMGKYEEALEHLEIAYSSFMKHYGTKNVANVMIVMSNQARALLELGRVEESLKVLDEIEEIAKAGSNETFIIDVIQTKIDAMRVLGDFKAAYFEVRRLVEYYSKWMKNLIRHPRAEVDMMLDNLKDFEQKLNRMNEELTLKNRLLDSYTKNNELIRDIGLRLTAVFDSKQIVEILAGEFEKIMSYKFLSIALIEGDNLVVRHAASGSMEYIELPVYMPLNNLNFMMTYCINKNVDLMIRERTEFKKYIIVDDANTKGQSRDKHIESAVYCRLKHGDEVIGLFTVQDFAKNSYGDIEFETIKEIASFVSIALVNARKNEQVRAKAEMLEAISLQDTLTRLGNRRAFNAQFSRLQESGEDFALIFVDMNHLKVINDMAGHAVGDRYLLAAGEILSSKCEGYGVFRLSGDEFAVLAPGLSEGDAMALVGNIKKACTEQKLGEYPLAVSVGYAFSNAESGANLLRSAESRMYADKAQYYAVNDIFKNGK